MVLSDGNREVASDPRPAHAQTSFLEDEAELRRLVTAYARMVDRRDWSLLSRIFTDAARLRGPGYAMRGHDELRAGLATIDRFSATMHLVMNQVVEVDGDRATGEVYCLANHLLEDRGQQAKLDMGIRYEDRYERTPQGWRIAERVLHVVWQQRLPLVSGEGREDEEREEGERT
jgi:hypothetical protein